jgi:pyruvate kinase
VTLREAINIANIFENIKYFAVSNVEDPQSLNDIKRQIRKDIEIVPKIETDAGVRNLDVIFKNVTIKYVMLDKEDLYLDVDKDSKMYEELVEMVRSKCKENKVELLELQGVIFTHTM